MSNYGVFQFCKGAKMEGKGKQNTAANTRNMSKNCMSIGVLPQQEMLVGDQLSSEDEELIIRYLDKKMIDQHFPSHTVHEVDFFLYHPQQLTQMYYPSQAKEWYFLSPEIKEYTEGGQSNSSNNDGYWEPRGTDSLIHKDGKLIGYRKTLNYIEGKHDKDRKKTEWLMHEYRLDRSRDVGTGMTSDDIQWIFCKLFKLNDNFIAAEEKEVAKFTGPDDGVSSMEQTIQDPEKTDHTINDKGPDTGLTGDLLPLPNTDQGAVRPHSSSKFLDQACNIWCFDKPLTDSRSEHDQGTMRPTPTPQDGQTTMFTPAGRRKATKKMVNNKRLTYRCKRPLLDSDLGSVMPQFMNANSGPQHDQGSMIPPPLPQNDQRTVLPTFTGPHNANTGVVSDKGPSNSLNSDSHPLAASSQGLMLPRCFENILDLPTGICSSGETIANSWRQHGTMLPHHGQPTILTRAQHDQQTIFPPLSGIHNAKNDEVSSKRPTLDHHHGARDPPLSVQVPKPSSVHGSPKGSHDDDSDVAEAPSYGGWPFRSPESALPPLRGAFMPLTDDVLAYFDEPDPGYPEAYKNKEEAK